MRQIVLDTETTGLEPASGHRIIEIGCLELINRRVTGSTWHTYLNPQREIETGATAVHGITTQFLADKPVFSAVAPAFLEYINGAELIIHNAPFDSAFLDAELLAAAGGYKKIADYCAIIDTLALARRRYPGQRNSLDALCKRLNIDNSHREFHGALLDARLLASVYLLMTGGQSELFGSEADTTAHAIKKRKRKVVRPETMVLAVIKADMAEIEAHNTRLDAIEKTAKKTSVWRELENV